MNKKFFTLIAGLLMLAASVGTGFAQVAIPRGIVPATIKSGNKYQVAITTAEYLENNGLTPALTGTAASFTTFTDWLKHNPTNANYHLNAEEIYTNLLGTPSRLFYGYIDKDGVLKSSTPTNFSGTYFESIFCVAIKNAEFGRRPVLDITNYPNNYQLLINPDEAQRPYTATPTVVTPINRPPGWPYPTLNAGTGSEGDWGFSNSYGTLPPPNPAAPAVTVQQHWQPLYVYLPGNNNTVIIFLADAQAPNLIRTTEWPIASLLAGDIPGAALLFEFIEPAPRVLNAEDFNTRLGTELNAYAQKLQFLGDREDRSPINVVPIYAPPSDPANFHPELDKLYAPWKNINFHAIDVSPIRPTNGALNVGAFDFLSPSTGWPAAVTIPAWVASVANPSIGDVNQGPWLYFQAAEGTRSGEFLYLDTAYYDVTTDVLRFNLGDTLDGYKAITEFVNTNYIGAGPGLLVPNSVINEGTASNPKYAVRVAFNATNNRLTGFMSDFINHYRFQVTYFWSNDSIAIDVAQANLRPQNLRAPAPPYARIPFYQFESTRWDDAPYYEWATIESRDPFLNSLGANTFADNDQTEANVKIDHAFGGTPRDVSADFLHVTLQGLANRESRVLSIGARPIQTKMRLGIPSCASSAGSVPEGVYVIRNMDGNMLLHVPIYSDTSALWVSKKESVDPFRMPSYHWIVKKNNKNDLAHSSVKLINREFPNVTFNNVRLEADAENGITLLNLPFELINNTVGKGKCFDPVPEDLLNKPFLGYYHSSGDALETYDLNYFNQFTTEQPYYLNKAEGADSTLLVNRVRSMQFSFHAQPGDANNRGRFYGYRPTTDADGIQTEDWKLVGVQLRRTAYKLVTKVMENNVERDKMFIVNREHRYALTNNVNRPTTAPNVHNVHNYGSVFFLKTNNTTGTDNDYYALLDTTSYSTLFNKYPQTNPASRELSYILGNTGSGDGTAATHGAPDGIYKITGGLGNQYDLRYVKLVIPDDIPWAYENEQNETRTSAFAVTRYNAPLYRRFDQGWYTYNSQTNPVDTVQEPYSAGKPDKDAPLYLKFHRIPQDWIYLYENSAANAANKFRPADLRNKNVSFLGLQDAVHFPELDTAIAKEGEYAVNYEFYVDTAFVKRTHGGEAANGTTITYKDYTPKPQYMLALRPSVLDSTEYSYEEGIQYWPPGEAPIHGQWPSGDYGGVKTVKVKAMTVGDYLFNAQDSVHVGNKDYLGRLIPDNIENDVRLAFVKGAHLGDTFYVLAGTRYENYTGRQIQLMQALDSILFDLPVYYKHYLGQNTHYVPRYTDGWISYGPPSAADMARYLDSVAVYKNKYGKLTNYSWLANGKSMVFQFRLKNVAGQENKTREFYIETTQNDGIQLGPHWAQFVNDHNGVPVISRSVQYPSGIINDAAMGMQVVKKAEPDYGKATAIEAISTESAKVIGNTGSVTILNASGKTVTVTNVLGQTVAKAVLSGNNATIALPKGIVVVNIDGASSKALVK